MTANFIVVTATLSALTANCCTWLAFHRSVVSSSTGQAEHWQAETAGGGFFLSLPFHLWLSAREMYA